MYHIDLYSTCLPNARTQEMVEQDAELVEADGAAHGKLKKRWRCDLYKEEVPWQRLQE